MIVTYETVWSFVRNRSEERPRYEYEVGDRVLIHGRPHTVTHVIEKPHGGFHGVGRYEVLADDGPRFTGTATGYFISPLLDEVPA